MRAAVARAKPVPRQSRLGAGHRTRLLPGRLASGALARRANGFVMAAVLACVCGGAGVTLMLSSYATGGQLGLPLAAVLAGAAMVTLASAGLRGTGSWVGPAVVGLFSLLLIGHFFGELTATHAAVLFAAPLLAWLPELPYARRALPWLKELARIVLVAALVAAVAFQAFRVFQEESKDSSGYEQDMNLQ